MISDFNMPHGKMSDLVSFPLLGFNLTIKLREVSTLKVIEILPFFSIKAIMSDLNFSCQTFSDLV